MKTRHNISIDDSLWNALLAKLYTPPKKSVSSWIEEQIHEYLEEQDKLKKNQKK